MKNILFIKSWAKDPFYLDEISRRLNLSGFRSRVVFDVEPKLKHRLWSLGRETAVICFDQIRKFKPDWAELWQQVEYNKIEECQILQNAGVPIPRWVGIYPDQTPDMSDFDEFVVVKPAVGAKGAMVRVMRKTKAVYRPLVAEGRGVGVSPALMAQEFIYTGPWPVSYRVGTIFGEPYYKIRFTADASREPFVGDNFDAQFFSGRTIVATSKGSQADGDVPQDVLDVARKAHDAFPTIPMLGTDIVRDARTGKLYVVEVNANGRTYLISEEERIKFLNSGVDVINQFNGIEAVVKGLVNRLKINDRKRFIDKESEDLLVSAGAYHG